MLKLHQFHLSGNCYKVRLCARHLGIPISLVDVDMMGGETRKAPFLAKNPNGRVPLLELEDGRTLPESNAILAYLADGTALWPGDRFARADALNWMAFEQYSHEPYIAVARFWLAFQPPEKRAEKRHLVSEWHQKGHAALKVMDAHLTTRDWFASDQFSIADIALYAYTHCADEGGFDLGGYPALGRWLNRVAGLDRHIALADR